MTSINRIDSNARLSRAVVHNGVVYLAGITATDCTQDIRNQTRDVLQKIEERLSQAGSDKDHILSAQIWLANIVQDFDPMNDEWSNWLGSAGRPARATCQVGFDDPKLLIEVIITAAVI
ncbi:RidA family protein [Pseudomonas putida]|uniref:RidA family protein n=1 Tax=Pseudomonas putida TaxID=303 RepID=UPI0029DE608D|nr:RidA family protein [Pseudomonas putida]WPK00696.1 RidA family protein [Pseudomonas putida]